MKKEWLMLSQAGMQFPECHNYETANEFLIKAQQEMAK
jgi:hypothetical protein